MRLRSLAPQIDRFFRTVFVSIFMLPFLALNALKEALLALLMILITSLHLARLRKDEYC